MISLPEHPVGIGRLIDNMITVYKACLPTIAKMAIMVSFCQELPTLFEIFFPQEGNGNNAQDFSNLDASLMPLVGVSLWLVLVAVVLGMIGYGALIFRMYSILEEEDCGLQFALNRGYRLLPTFIGATILVALWVTLGFILFIIPGIIISVYLLFTPYLVYTTELGAFGSMRMSRDLVRGSWWRISIILTVLFLVIIVLFIILGVIAGVLFGAMGESFTLKLIGTLALIAINGLLILPLSIAGMLVIIRDLQIRKTGTDLSSRVENL